MNPLCCIFDLDGVLVDTATFHYRAWRRLAAELGFDFSEQQNERLKGVSRMASLELLLAAGGITGLTAAEKRSLAAKKNAWYVAYVEKMTPRDVLPGVTAFLQALRARGVKTALGSASRNAPLILQRTGLAPLFDVVVDGNAVTRAKPDPDVFLRCAAALDVPPAACLVFEDAAAGVEAARRAGMTCIGVGDPAVLRAAAVTISGLQQLTINN
jgi:beta-phosphoglucomutase